MIGEKVVLTDDAMVHPWEVEAVIDSGFLLDGYTYRLRIPNNTGESRSSTTISQGQSTVIYTPVLSVSLTKRTRSLLQKCVFTKQDN